MTLLLSIVMMLADTTLYGPTPESIVTETQHTGEVVDYGNVEAYFRNVFLKRWPERNLNHFVGISRYWPGATSPLDEAATVCEQLMCEEL